MRMVFLSFSEDQTDEVMEILKSERIGDYVRWDEIKGQSSGYRPRMGTDVWPGHSGAVVFPLTEERIAVLCETVEKFNREAEYEGISMFVWNIDCMVLKEPKKREPKQ